MLENTLVTFGVEDDFLNSAPKTKLNGKNGSDYIKVKNFCLLKDTVDKGSRWETDWERIIRTFKTDKGLISRIIKQFLQINKKKRNWQRI